MICKHCGAPFNKHFVSPDGMIQLFYHEEMVVFSKDDTQCNALMMGFKPLPLDASWLEKQRYKARINGIIRGANGRLEDIQFITKEQFDILRGGSQ